MNTIDTISLLESYFLDHATVDHQTALDLWDAILYYQPMLVQTFYQRTIKPIPAAAHVALETTATILLFDLFCGNDYAGPIRLKGLWHTLGLDRATYTSFQYLLIQSCMDLLQVAVMTFDLGYRPWEDRMEIDAKDLATCCQDLYADEAI